jgi:hypothetical protein
MHLEGIRSWSTMRAAAVRSRAGVGVLREYGVTSTRDDGGIKDQGGGCLAAGQVAPEMAPREMPTDSGEAGDMRQGSWQVVVLDVGTSRRSRPKKIVPRRIVLLGLQLIGWLVASFALIGFGVPPQPGTLWTKKRVHQTWATTTTRSKHSQIQ